MLSHLYHHFFTTSIQEKKKIQQICVQCKEIKFRYLYLDVNNQTKCQINNENMSDANSSKWSKVIKNSKNGEKSLTQGKFNQRPLIVNHQSMFHGNLCIKYILGTRKISQWWTIVNLCSPLIELAFNCRGKTYHMTSPSAVCFCGEEKGNLIVTICKTKLKTQNKHTGPLASSKTIQVVPFVLFH